MAGWTHGIAAGFHIAAAAGPLCRSPLWGVALQLEVAVAPPKGFGREFDPADAAAWADIDWNEAAAGPLSGQVRPSKRFVIGS